MAKELIIEVPLFNCPNIDTLIGMLTILKDPIRIKLDTDPPFYYF